MTNILKATKLDIYVSKAYLKQYPLLLLTPIIFVVLLKSVSTGISFAMCSLAMTSNFSFSAIEKNNSDRLYGLLPIKKSELVSGKYLFIAALGIIALVACLILSIFMLKIMKYSVAYNDYFIGISIGIFTYFASTAIQLPIYYKYGFMKSKIAASIPYICYMILLYISIKMKSRDIIFLLQIFKNPYASLVISISLSIILYIISIEISSDIMTKKEL